MQVWWTVIGEWVTSLEYDETGAWVIVQCGDGDVHMAQPADLVLGSLS
jgi:hypothetical protein